MYAVPVKCETHAGFGEMQGMLRLEGQHLVLQYQTADSMFGVLRSQPKSMEIALGSIVHARFGAGWFWLAPYVELRLSDFQALAQLPAAEAGRIMLRVRMADRRDARRLIEHLNQLCAEKRYALLNQEIEQMSQSHPLADARLTGRVTVPPPPPRAQTPQ